MIELPNCSLHVASQDGGIRTHVLRFPKPAEYQTFPHPETKSAQRDLNPRTLHGKQEGYHYIMGAELCMTELSKIAIEGEPRRHRRNVIKRSRQSGTRCLPSTD